MVKLLLIILLIVIGSKVIYKDNFATIIGSLKLNASSDGSSFKDTLQEIDLPKGFTSENCSLISFGGTTNLELGYSYDRGIDDAMSLYYGALPKMATFKKDNKISIRVYNKATESFLYHYKIVLMKYEITQGEYVLGDLNEDGVINETDVEILQSFIVGEIPLTSKQLKSADVNKDGIINSEDTLKLRKYIEGIIDSLE